MLRNLLLAGAAVTLAFPAAAQVGAQPGGRNATQAGAPVADTAAISGLGVRNIGSARMSGRIVALAVRKEKDGKYTLLVGSA